MGQKKLRKNKELTRLGSMFGEQQFCYAEKPGGVEPGFRAIDLNEEFFTELNNILSNDNLISNTQLSGSEKEQYTRLRDLLNINALPEQQRVFASFIHINIKGPQKPESLNSGISWLCKEIKAAVDENKKLSAWMYKLDYAEGEKERINVNKEAIREYVGTRLAGIFSAQNQKQEVVWVNGKRGAHALLACGWKGGLKQLKDFLHGGSEPDYNGVLVENVHAFNKYSKRIPGLGKNLIFGIAIGDRDGMGKEAQNKGIADGVYYGFDYGKPYEGEGVCPTLQNDFSFEDKYAKTFSVFRGSSIIGFARHFMYRNYSVFYDTSLTERIFGLHLMRKMIMGENPSEDVIKSYPGLRLELNHIQGLTPTPTDLLNQLSNIRLRCKEGGSHQLLADTYMMQISTGKISHFDRYFAKIKIDIIEEATKSNMPYDELEQYMKFIDEMAATAAKSNEVIVNVFEQRALLTKREIDLLDKLEKIYSPTAVMSHDGTVFLNTMRFDPHSERIPFQLKREIDKTYTLSTTDNTLVRQLKDDFGIDFIQSKEGLSCNIIPEQLAKLMTIADTKYNKKRTELLVKPTYYYETFPCIVSLMNQGSTSESTNVKIGYLWRTNNSLSLRIVPKTGQQVQLIQQLFKKVSKINEAEIIEVSKEALIEFQAMVEKTYEEIKRIQDEIKVDKWEILHRKSEKPSSISTTILLLTQESAKLIRRYEGLVSGSILTELKDAIKEISDVSIIQKLLSYNDKTLIATENIGAIIEENVGDIIIIVDELVITTLTSTDSNNLHPSSL